MELFVVCGGRVGKLTSLSELGLVLNTLVDDESGITTIVDEHVTPIGAFPSQHLLGAVPVLLETLTLPRENVGGLCLNNCSGSVILSREDVA